jgi:hypothetical protein
MLPDLCFSSKQFSLAAKSSSSFSRQLLFNFELFDLIPKESIRRRRRLLGSVSISFFSFVFLMRSMAFK